MVPIAIAVTVIPDDFADFDTFAGIPSVVLEVPALMQKQFLQLCDRREVR
jgi:hypothetical protein